MKLINVDNIYAWLYLFATMPQLLFTAWAFSRCFELKVSRKAYFIIFTGLAFAYLATPIFLGIYVPAKTFVLLAIQIVAMWLMSKSGLVKAIIFNGFDMVINMLLEFALFMSFFGAFLAENEITTDVYTNERVIATVLFTVLALPLKYLLAVVWNKVTGKKQSGLRISLIAFPIAQVLVITAIVSSYSPVYEKILKVDIMLVTTIGLVIFVIADLIYMFFISDIEKKNALEIEVNSLQYAHELEEQHFRQVEEKRYEVAKIRHDINNQLTTIKSMVHSGHIEQAEELIGELENTVSQTKEYQYCSIPVVNAVISEKNKEAEKHGIKLATKIDVEDACGITQHHLCSVFANLIDNAIRAERGFAEIDSDKKIITVNAFSDSVSVYITVKNYVSGVEIPREDNSSLHGYGQQILSDIARIYSGSFDKTEKDGEYSCTLTLRKKAQEEIKIGS